MYLNKKHPYGIFKGEKQFVDFPILGKVSVKGH